MAGAYVASTTSWGDCGLHVRSQGGYLYRSRIQTRRAWWGSTFHKLSSAMELAEL